MESFAYQQRAELRREESIVIKVTEDAKVSLSTVDLGTLDSGEGAVLRLDPVAYDEVAGELTLSFAPGEAKATTRSSSTGARRSCISPER
jgi:hypothetical protein